MKKTEINQYNLKYPLTDTWSLYCHLPYDKSWALSSYTVIMDDIDDVQKSIAINETVPKQVIQTCMLFVMRNGITPLWEDAQNIKGGAFSYKVPIQNVNLVWRSLFYSLVGETLCVNHSHCKNINGISISPKKGFSIIKIWMANMDNQDPNMIIHIDNLAKEGCLFKAHNEKEY